MISRILCLTGIAVAFPTLGCSGEQRTLTIEFVFPSPTESNKYTVEATVDLDNGVKFVPDENGIARLVVPETGNVLIADDYVFTQWHRSSVRVGDKVFGNDEVEVVSSTAVSGSKITKTGNRSESISTHNGTKHRIELRVSTVQP
jgi:hypothetical protein